MTTILNAIGNTPLIRLNKMFPNQEIYLKLEGQNPGGSVKDRVAKFLVEQGLINGELKEGMIILEATSGNMGIALAMIGAARGIPVKIIMSEGMSIERREMIRAFGAELILTDVKNGTTGAREEMLRLVKKYPEKYWMANQFNNENNSRAHELSLAPEIYSQLPSLKMVVAGIGTSGTIMGLARFFQKKNKNISIVAVQPPAGFEIQGIQHPEKDFLPEIWDKKLISKIINITKEDAFDSVRKVAKEEGILVGHSTGAALSAVKNIQEIGPVVLISADRGEKYLSTSLFKN
jgi:cysteine synthase